MAEKIVLSRDTLIPAGFVLALVVVILGGWNYLEGRFDAMLASQDKIDRRLEKLEEREADRWTYTQQKLWVSELRRLNPTLTVPGGE